LCNAAANGNLAEVKRLIQAKGKKGEEGAERVGGGKKEGRGLLCIRGDQEKKNHQKSFFPTDTCQKQTKNCFPKEGKRKATV